MARAQYELNWESTEDRDVLAIMAAFDQQNRARAQAQFAAIARGARDRVFLKAGDLGGFLGARIHAASFHYWGQRLGYACWNDPQFRREYLRDNEYARVQSRPRQTTVRMPEKAHVNFGRGTIQLAE